MQKVTATKKKTLQAYWPKAMKAIRYLLQHPEMGPMMRQQPTLLTPAHGLMYVDHWDEGRSASGMQLLCLLLQSECLFPCLEQHVDSCLNVRLVNVEANHLVEATEEEELFLRGFETLHAQLLAQGQDPGKYAYSTIKAAYCALNYVQELQTLILQGDMATSAGVMSSKHIKNDLRQRKLKENARKSAQLVDAAAGAATLLDTPRRN